MGEAFAPSIVLVFRTAMPRCIYCSEDKPKEAFNADHVVPVMLGRFRQFETLHDAVCLACNQFFGDKVELVLGRDSHEGLRRLALGIKPARYASEYRSRLVELTMPPGSPWEGARLTIGASADRTGIIINLVPQIGVRREIEAHWTFLDEAAFRAADDDLFGVGPQKRRVLFRVLANDAVTWDRLLDLVRERVPGFRIDGTLPPPPVRDGQLDVQIVGTVDKVLARAIAKIAFNYVTLMAGTAFALDPVFDPARQFIRYGEGERRAFVHVSAEQLLLNEPPGCQITDCHLVIVQWSRRRGIIADVCPFNELHYTIRLAPDGPRLWRPLAVGHHFDWRNNEATPLIKIRSSLLAA